MGRPNRVLQDQPMQSQHQRRRFDVRDRAPQRGGWISSQQALDHLGLDSLGALYWHIKENRLPYGRIGGRYRFQVADLDAWLDRTSAAALKKVV